MEFTNFSVNKALSEHELVLFIGKLLSVRVVASGDLDGEWDACLLLVDLDQEFLSNVSLTWLVDISQQEELALIKEIASEYSAECLFESTIFNETNEYQWLVVSPAGDVFETRVIEHEECMDVDRSSWVRLGG